MKSLLTFFSATVPQWVSDSFPTIRVVLIILLSVVAVVIVAAVLLTPSQNDGLGVLSGQSSETYYAKHKKQSLEGIVKKVTVISGIVAAVICIMFFVTLAIYNPLLPVA